jgi:hypothetical protein
MSAFDPKLGLAIVLVVVTLTLVGILLMATVR